LTATGVKKILPEKLGEKIAIYRGPGPELFSGQTMGILPRDDYLTFQRKICKQARGCGESSSLERFLGPDPPYLKQAKQPGYLMKIKAALLLPYSASSINFKKAAGATIFIH
jgi:hypothetical protein